MKWSVIILISTFFAYSCNNPFFEEVDDYVKSDQMNSQDSNIFNYETTNEIEYTIETIYPNVPIEIYYGNMRRVIGMSNRKGLLSGVTTLPTYIQTIEIRTDYISLPNSVTVGIENGQVNFKYFTKPTLPLSASRNFGFNGTNKGNKSEYIVLGSWDSQGVPNNLITPEELSESFLSVLNSVLPERQPVPEYNPQYLNEGALTNINMIEDGEVFVTFIHEGAGYKNSLMFFTYNTADGEPDSVSSEDLTIIFPNVSYIGSGGGLKSGDRIKIGEFQSGTTIVWALVADGYSTSTETVGEGRNTFYSIDRMNIEPEPNNQHVVQIAFDERVVLSFEDLVRTEGDNDFNDAVFSVTSNPITAIDRNDIVTPEESPTIDSDGDGVIDSLDPYPEDSNIAGVEYYPAQNEYGTIAFEDLWPHMGDYDFNDLVLDIRIEEYTNVQGEIVSVKGWFLIQGILASMRNGFALELGVASTLVEGTTGGEFSRGYIIREPNGTEKRQANAVIGIFEDANLHFDNGIGTELEVTINFSEPVPRSQLGFPPYNPFIMSNGERGREVHLPGHNPTELVHTDYFKTVDDNSTFVEGNSYKTTTDHPWALHLPVSFKYPNDDIAIDSVYNHFNSWVSTKGALNTDWYLDNQGYINHNLLFIR